MRSIEDYDSPQLAKHLAADYPVKISSCQASFMIKSSKDHNVADREWSWILARQENLSVLAD